MPGEGGRERCREREREKGEVGGVGGVRERGGVQHAVLTTRRAYGGLSRGREQRESEAEERIVRQKRERAQTRCRVHAEGVTRGGRNTWGA